MLHSLSVPTRPSLDQAQIQRIYQADLIAVDPLADIA